MNAKNEVKTQSQGLPDGPYPRRRGRKSVAKKFDNGLKTSSKSPEPVINRNSSSSATQEPQVGIKTPETNKSPMVSHPTPNAKPNELKSTQTFTQRPSIKPIKSPASGLVPCAPPPGLKLIPCQPPRHLLTKSRQVIVKNNDLKYIVGNKESSEKEKSVENISSKKVSSPPGNFKEVSKKGNDSLFDMDEAEGEERSRQLDDAKGNSLFDIDDAEDDGNLLDKVQKALEKQNNKDTNENQQKKEFRKIVVNSPKGPKTLKTFSRVKKKPPAPEQPIKIASQIEIETLLVSQEQRCKWDFLAWI